MNKTAIRNFAIWARVNLIQSVSQKAYQYGIVDGGSYQTGVTVVDGRVLSASEQQARDQLVHRINEIGYTEVIEEVAYTWFNRFTALRFMEVNEYLPSKVRLFSDENGAFNPDILKEALNVELDGLDRNKVVQYIETQNNEELYQYLLTTQCNALSGSLSPLFAKLEQYVALLIPNNLLRGDSVLYKMVNDIPVDDWKEQVEIIGWLYQYYISERHEAVVDPLHGKVISKEDIPAATQLFTTEWVVQYIIDNSLGRYWIERNPQSNLKQKLQFFVAPKNGELNYINEHVSPEQLTVLDPCVGSGHFLAYAFDVLMEIYLECGYSDRDAAESILRHNLYGLDLDNRAVQLACFSLKMKARSYNRRILSKTVDDLPLNVYCIEESNWLDQRLFSYLGEHKQTALQLKWCFADGKEYGSLIHPDVTLDQLHALKQKLQQLNATSRETLSAFTDIDPLYYGLMPLVCQAEVLVGKYAVVATNPPYLNKYDAKLSKYVKDHYEDYKGDLFSVFIFRNFDFCQANGYSGLMTPFVWMFIKSYEKLREYIINNKSIATLIQMEYSAYDEATVPICSFVLKNGKESDKGLYLRLSAFVGGMEVQKQKVLEALDTSDCKYFYETAESNFSKIPGSPIAYWVGQNLLIDFQIGKPLESIAYPRQGMATTNNDRFLRLWYEVIIERIGFGLNGEDDTISDILKWFPYNKGGNFRRWYGNNDYVVNFQNKGVEVCTYIDSHSAVDHKGRVINRDKFFKPSVTWSKISSSSIAFRYKPRGFIFDVAGTSIFGNDRTLDNMMGFLNSKVALSILACLSPTLNYEVGHICTIPILETVISESGVYDLVNCNKEISKRDWDSFETSWDFKKHPLV